MGAEGSGDHAAVRTANPREVGLIAASRGLHPVVGAGSFTGNVVKR